MAGVLQGLMAIVYRQDRLPQQLSPPVQGPGGVLLVEGVAARAGIYKYINRDGTIRRELVDEACLAEMTSDSGVWTLGRAPLTLHHPPEMVTADNAAKYTVGDVDSEICVAPGGYVRVKLAVRTKDAQDALAEGIVELSPGYLVEVDDTPGEHPVYGQYDSRQVSRRYNHLAIVDAARGGPECRIALDAMDARSSEEIFVHEKTTSADGGASDDAEGVSADTSADAAEASDEVGTIDAVVYSSTSTQTEEVEPDGARRFTYTSESVHRPESKELPDGITPAMAAWFKAAIAEALASGESEDACEEPHKDAANTATETVDREALDSDFLTRYKTRRSLEDRIDGVDIDNLSDEAIACAVLRQHSVAYDDLTARERIDRALEFPAVSRDPIPAPTPAPAPWRAGTIYDNLRP